MRYILLLFILLTTYIYSEEKQLKLGWKPVGGSNGYQLEIQGEKNFSRILSLDSNLAELSLNPGKYSVRVAALNKFKKPARFSEWKNFEIEDSSALQEFDLGAEGKVLEKKKEIVQNEPIPFWKIFVPGLVTWQANKNKSILIWTGLGVVLGYNYMEKRKGDVLAGEYENKQNYILPSLLLYPQLFGPLTLYQRNEDRRVYDLHQENQRKASYLLAGLYILSTADAYFFRKKIMEGTELSVSILPVGHRQEFAFQLIVRF